MQNFKRKVLLMGMYLHLVSLSLNTCGDNGYNYEVMRGSLKIHYEEDNTINSGLTYEEVEKYLKVVTIEHNGFTKTYLMLRDFDSYSGRYGNIYTKYTKLKYLDLKTGVIMLYYYWENKYSEDEIKEKEPDEIYVGKNSKIICEQDFINYLIREDKIERNYTVQELIEFFENIVKPSLNEEDALKKELVK